MGKPGKAGLQAKCLYAGVLHSHPLSDAAEIPKCTAAPEPFFPNQPPTNRQSFAPDATLQFENVLLGAFIEALPSFVLTFKETGR